MIVSPFNKEFTWEIKKKILGMRGEDWSRVVIDELGLNEEEMSCEMMVEKWQENLRDLMHEVNICDGALETVETLKFLYQDQDGDDDENQMKLAIATSSNSSSGPFSHLISNFL